MWRYPPSTILVPVDFGEASASALRVAATLADRLGAVLRILHVEMIEAPAYFTAGQVAVLERERKDARARAAEFVQQFAAQNGAISASVQIIEGPPVEGILTEAEKADLVVMGTHGRRGATLWWMGSVAERVVRESVTPVMVIRAELSGAPAEIFTRPLVVATTAGTAGEAMRLASGLADTFGGVVSEPVARCEADLADRQSASLIVVEGPAEPDGILGPGAVERWIRRCTLPMLFVSVVNAVASAR